MKLDVRIGERTRRIELECEKGPAGASPRMSFRLDGVEVAADAVEVATGTYSILLGGNAFEVRVQPEGEALRVYAGGQEFSVQVIDPRAWHGRRGGALALEGRQRIVAPMPGKVVRVLVAQGAQVEAGQGLFVVEAMKMQNEIRSPKAGVVEKLSVVEGQAVNVGETLAVVV
jgi:biotin carboxyl carrier protein